MNKWFHEQMIQEQIIHVQMIHEQMTQEQIIHVQMIHAQMIHEQIINVQMIHEQMIPSSDLSINRSFHAQIIHAQIIPYTDDPWTDDPCIWSMHRWIVHTHVYVHLIIQSWSFLSCFMCQCYLCGYLPPYPEAIKSNKINSYLCYYINKYRMLFHHLFVLTMYEANL